MFYVSGFDIHNMRVKIHDTDDGTDEILDKQELDRIKSLGIPVEGISCHANNLSVQVSERITESPLVLKMQVLYDCTFEYDRYYRLSCIKFNKSLPTWGRLLLSTVSYAFVPYMSLIECPDFEESPQGFTLVFDKDLWYTNFEYIDMNILTLDDYVYVRSLASKVHLDLREANNRIRKDFVNHVPDLVIYCIYDENLMLRCAEKLVFGCNRMGVKSAEFLKQGNLDAKFLERYGEKLLRATAEIDHLVSYSQSECRRFSEMSMEEYLNNLDSGIPRAFPASFNYFRIGGRSKKVFKAVKMQMQKLLKVGESCTM